MFGFECEFIRTDPLEVVVEESIEDGVGADGGDADEVEDHEEGHHVLGVVEQVRHLCHQAEQAAKISRNHLCLNTKQLQEKDHLYTFPKQEGKRAIKTKTKT